MKKLFFILFSLLSLSLFADESCEVSEAPPINTHIATTPLIYDKYFSPYAGGSDIISIERLLMKSEDAILGRKNGVSESFLSGMGRLLDLAVIWGPINSISYLTQRTFCGFEFRNREFRDAALVDIDIKSKIPGYYNYTSIDISFYPETQVTQVIDTFIAGFEASSILSGQLRSMWTASKRMDGRQGLLYALSALDLAASALNSQSGSIQNPVDAAYPLTEVESYVYYMKTLYPTMPINLNNLTLKSLVNLADPFLWYSLYSQLYYVVKGTPLDVSMFPFFGKSGYLPVFQLALAPYGPEFYFQNYFRTAKGSPIMVYGKWGSLAHNLHWGVGFEAPYLIRTPQQTLGFKFDYFDQYEPNADLTFEEAGEESSFEYQGVHRISGYAFSFIGTQSFDRFPSSGLYLQAGFKTEGYLPGESLKAGLIARAGFSITF